MTTTIDGINYLARTPDGGTAWINLPADRTPEELATRPKRAPKPKTTRTLVFDKYAPTAVLRWMGASSWTFQAAKDCFSAKGFPVADTTIRAQLHAGKHGQRGPAAPVTYDEACALGEF